MSAGWARKSLKGWDQPRRLRLLANPAGWRTSTIVAISKVLASQLEENAAMGSFMSGRARRRRAG